MNNQVLCKTPITIMPAFCMGYSQSYFCWIPALINMFTLVMMRICLIAILTKHCDVPWFKNAAKIPVAN